MGNVERVVKARDRASHTRGLIEGIERTALQASAELRRAFALLRHDIDHATDGVRPIQTALRTAEHFDLRDVRRKHLTEIEDAVLAGIIRVDSVDQHFGMIRIAAAHEYGRLAARTSGLNNVQAGHGPENVGQRALLIALDLFLRDDRHRTSDFVDRCFDSGRADDDPFRFCFRRVCYRVLSAADEWHAE
jgi:hypothetical protein